MFEKIKKFVQNELSTDTTGHDWYHSFRVWKMAKYIGSKEGADLSIIEPAALLHDVEDWKFVGDENYTGTRVRNWLSGMSFKISETDKICEIIDNISFKGAQTDEKPNKTIELAVVQDADRLDALGAVGIARAFAYGGFKKQEIYNPEILPVLHESFEEYKTSKTTTINHFYEKLLLLRDRMNTKTGKLMAEKRHNFLENFLNSFLAEWNGEYV